VIVRHTYRRSPPSARTFRRTPPSARPNARRPAAGSARTWSCTAGGVCSRPGSGRAATAWPGMRSPLRAAGGELWHRWGSARLACPAARTRPETGTGRRPGSEPSRCGADV